eukprot:TRINITY_DN38218_c0_g1_i1.p1 TRINITY_DN38218_c0_g1~~TRINITY_DN38218_c0_g1_i1.p1  ORF type:complete len:796 (+),score=150.53 TRINITY_DN38218_c0_g1_i1:86-2473(+)
MVCCCFPFRKAVVVGECGQADDVSTQGSARDGGDVSGVLKRGKGEAGSARQALLPFLSNTQKGDGSQLAVLARTEFVEHLKAKITPHEVEPTVGMPTISLPDPVILLKGPPDLCLKTGISVKTLTTICRSISQSIDALLYPLVDTAIDEHEWQVKIKAMRPDVADVVERCKKIVNNQAAIPTGVQAGLLALGWIAGLLSDHSPMAIVPSSLYVSSVCRLVGLIEHVLTDACLAHFVGLLKMSGVLLNKPSELEKWNEHLPFYALHPGVKGQVLRRAVKRTNPVEMSLLDIPREGVLDCVMATAMKAGVFKGHCGSEGKLVTMLTEGGGDVKGAREIFEMLSKELVDEWAVCGKWGGGCLVECSTYVRVSTVENPNVQLSSFASMFSIGAKITFTDISTLYTHHHFTIPDTISFIILECTPDPDSPTHYLLKTDRTAPLTAANLPFTLCKPRVPLFRIEKPSSSVWFNTSISSLTPSTYTGSYEQDKYLDLYAFLGWLIAEAIVNNAVLNLSLPLAFFSMLKSYPTYNPTAADLLSLGASKKTSIERIKAMNQWDFVKLLESHDLPKDFTAGDYIRYVAEDVLVRQVGLQVSAVVDAVQATGLRDTAVWKHMLPEEVRVLVCGRYGEDAVYHCLRYEFMVAEDEEFKRYEYGEVFLEILWDVLHSAGKQEKRLFLKFLTGTSSLPPVSQSEVLRIECFSSPHASPEALQLRLPQTHTCHNTLSIPNYAEAILFSTTSEWRALTSHQGDVTEEHRQAAWKVITSSSQHNAVRQKIFDLTQKKLRQAIGATEDTPEAV